MLEVGGFFLLSSVWTYIAQKRFQTGKRPRTYIQNYETYNSKRESIINGGVNDLLVRILCMALITLTICRAGNFSHVRLIYFAIHLYSIYSLVYSDSL